jgi:hypothetical protein
LFVGLLVKYEHAVDKHHLHLAAIHASFFQVRPSAYFSNSLGFRV